ncbi:MAG TPA: asparagine synthase (glutamine-hydrolyzing), partial [Sumerlaeia bacterium]|nr:asparagine synthase (glutamine-hydrolyzing) [Sumerlaeia bacterium]
MCGIAGLFTRAPASDLDARLAAMLETLAHRGPDDEGTWTSADGRRLLGHKRLSIIDLAGGRQPMANENESVWITFNGCIYNYEDLARDLRQAGHAFRTHSDTEVIVHAYEEWGPNCVERFNGMWAFAICDEKRKTLFCSRDRLGVKPFYYVWDGETFAFASEIKALLTAGAVRAEVDPDGLRQYLTFQFCLGEKTLFQNVRKLEPGFNLLLPQDGEPKQDRYWDVPGEVDLEHDEDYFVERLEWLMQDAVRLRLRADVPLGTHLSGGLDSSTVLALARLLLGEATPIKTFTGAFGEGAAFDETRYAKIMAKAAGSEYIEIYLGAEDFRNSIEKIVWFMDEPAAGPGVFPQFWVSKLAAENVTVVLGGQGGDENFIGYARYLLAYLEECLRGAIEDTAHRSKYVATLETIVPSLPDLQNYFPMLKSFWSDGLFDEPARRYYRLMDRFVQSRRLLHPDLEVDTDKTFEGFRAIFEGHRADASPRSAAS